MAVVHTTTAFVNAIKDAVLGHNDPPQLSTHTNIVQSDH